VTSSSKWVDAKIYGLSY